MVRRKLAIFGQIVVFILVMFAIYLHLNPIATSGSEQGLGSLDAQSSQEGHDGPWAFPILLWFIITDSEALTGSSLTSDTFTGRYNDVHQSHTKP